MSCTTLRQRLLASERPDQPDAAAARHLTRCPACCAWLQRVARLEEMLPQVPVPPSEPPAALLAMLRSAPLRPLVRPTPLPLSTLPRQEGARQKLALSLALAAALVLFALGWWSWPHALSTDVPVRDHYRTFVDGRMKYAPTAEQRVSVLRDIAAEWLAEARTLPSDERLAQLARDFHRLVHHDLPYHARKVPRPARASVLGPLADQLGRTESEASRVAAVLLTRPSAAEHLRRIAVSAHEAEHNLRLLCRV
jgi:hypothetical protein